MELTNSLFREDHHLWNGDLPLMPPDLQVCPFSLNMNLKRPNSSFANRNQY